MSDAPLYRAAFPSGPPTDVDTGELTPQWRGFFQVLYIRTGGANGFSITDVGTGLENETAARIAADNTLTTNLAAETSARQAADAGLLPLAGGTMSGALSTPQVTATTHATPAGPTWTSGSGVPKAAAPSGSLYSRTDGALGARLYVSGGGGTWHAVTGV
jgi:hypothetical protein